MRHTNVILTKCKRCLKVHFIEAFFFCCKADPNLISGKKAGKIQTKPGPNRNPALLPSAKQSPTASSCRIILFMVGEACVSGAEADVEKRGADR